MNRFLSTLGLALFAGAPLGALALDRGAAAARPEPAPPQAPLVCTDCLQAQGACPTHAQEPPAPPAPPPAPALPPRPDLAPEPPRAPAQPAPEALEPAARTISGLFSLAPTRQDPAADESAMKRIQAELAELRREAQEIRAQTHELFQRALREAGARGDEGGLAVRERDAALAEREAAAEAERLARELAVQRDELELQLSEQTAQLERELAEAHDALQREMKEREHEHARRSEELERDLAQAREELEHEMIQRERELAAGAERMQREMEVARRELEQELSRREHGDADVDEHELARMEADIERQIEALEREAGLREADLSREAERVETEVGRRREGLEREHELALRNYERELEQHERDWERRQEVYERAFEQAREQYERQHERQAEAAERQAERARADLLRSLGSGAPRCSPARRTTRAGSLEERVAALERALALGSALRRAPFTAAPPAAPRASGSCCQCPCHQAGSPPAAPEMRKAKAEAEAKKKKAKSRNEEGEPKARGSVSQGSPGPPAVPPPIAGAYPDLFLGPAFGALPGPAAGSARVLPGPGAPSAPPGPRSAAQPLYTGDPTTVAGPRSGRFVAARVAAAAQPREELLIEMRALVGEMIAEVQSLRRAVGELRDEVVGRR